MDGPATTSSTTQSEPLEVHPIAKIFYGPIISPVTLTTYNVLPRCLLAVDREGKVAWLLDDVDEDDLVQRMAEKACMCMRIDRLKEGEFIIPGFIDTHTHAPQFPNIGSGQQYELLDWLDKVTFPTEAKFADTKYARETYESVVKRVLDCGTTTCCYYGTLHLEATKILADIVDKKGQRAFVGKCNMNRNCPGYYQDLTSDDSIHNTTALISYIRALHHHHHQKPFDPLSPPPKEPLVQPILTPRFAIACSDELLSSLGELAKSDPTLHIQTHISENKKEIDFTKQLFPNAPNYAGVYDMFGLLRNNTVLAHGVWLDDDEIRLVAERKAGISHCPVSNFNISSGIAPIGKYLDNGIKVGLGTDVSGGYSPSILTVIQSASIAAKCISLRSPSDSKIYDGTKFEGRQLPVATLFYLATLGGAQVCDIDKYVGSIEEGKSFDALVVDVSDDAGNPGIWGFGPDGEKVVNTNPGTETRDIKKEKDELEKRLERFLFCGDDRNIAKVFVQGKLVGGKRCIG
ncbi:hypothetical protein AX16_001589 [Volvariella volvacea WC 439]|nr:hypothetical protein AX16_001589 [Volvariella volvacea WC 439]